jgi:hypothetical protein
MVALDAICAIVQVALIPSFAWVIVLLSFQVTMYHVIVVVSPSSLTLVSPVLSTFH